MRQMNRLVVNHWFPHIAVSEQSNKWSADMKRVYALIIACNRFHVVSRFFLRSDILVQTCTIRCGVPADQVGIMRHREEQLGADVGFGCSGSTQCRLSIASPPQSMCGCPLGASSLIDGPLSSMRIRMTNLGVA